MTVDATGPTPVVELPPLQDDRLYTAEEISPYVGVGPRFLKRAASADTIQHTYLGRFPRWSAQHVRDIVAGVPHEPSRRPRQTHKAKAAA
jgi:hypothetical protein